MASPPSQAFYSGIEYWLALDSGGLANDLGICDVIFITLPTLFGPGADGPPQSRSSHPVRDGSGDIEPVRFFDETVELSNCSRVDLGI